MDKLRIARETLARVQARLNEMEAALKKQNDGKKELQTEIDHLKDTLEAERAAAELFRLQAQAKIEEMGGELRR